MKKIDKILLVDDDPVSNYMTTYFLQKTGICNNITILKNGLEALLYLEENHCNPPDVILLDVHMPVMDGLEFLSRVQLINFNLTRTQIVLYTINTNDIERQRAHFGVELIDKPLTVSKFYKAIGASHSLAS